MQTYEQTGISATLTVTEAELGFDPSNYTHHTITVSGLTTPASDQFYIEGRLAGTSTYGYLTTALANGSVALVADLKLDAFRISFTASVTAAKFSVQSLSRQSSIEL